jgi:hypothetical protein
VLTLLLTPSGATFSMLLRFRLLGASAIGEDFWRWRPLLKGSLSRCGDSVSLPMDRDRPMPPFIFPQNKPPTLLLSQLHCHLTQTQETRDLPPHFLLAPPKLATIQQEIQKLLQLTALSTTWQQQATEF